MRSTRYSQVPSRLVRAAARFADWRRTRVIGSRIPKSLWASAVRLAAELGISRTATALRLSYYELKKHVESKAPPSRRASVAKAKPAFVEWPAPTLPAPPECVIELENAAGSKMRIHLKGSHGPDLVALSGSFWNPQQ